MQDKNFEQHIEKKLEELRFVPSEKVWENVERSLQKDKRPRIAAWWFAPLFLLIMGWGIFKLSSTPALENEHKTADKKTTPAENAQSNNRTFSNSSTAISPLPIPNVAEKNSIIKKEKLAATQSTISAPATIYHASSNNSQGSVIIATNKKENKEKNHRKPVNKDGGLLVNINSPGTETDSEAVKNNPAVNEDVAVSEEKEKQVEAVTNKAEKQNAAPELNLSDPAKTKKKNSSWQIGYTGRAGLAAINQLTHLNSNEPSAFLYDNTGSTSIPSSGTTIIVSNSYQFKKGAQFGAGVLAQKKFSGRWFAETGALYNYTKIALTRRQRTDSLFAGTGVVNSYVRFDNYEESLRLHLFELPLTAGYKILEGRKLNLDMKFTLMNSLLLSDNWGKYKAILGNKKTYFASLYLSPAFNISNWKGFSFGPYAGIGLNKFPENKQLINAGLQVIYSPKQKK